MAKLDRQLDDVYGEKRVSIEWPEGSVVDAGQIESMLRAEIDSHHQRIPLDLRGVHGAPPELIELLIDCQRYARERGKLISISYAFPAMQEALRPQRRRKSGRPQDAIDGEIGIDASETAKSLLDSRIQSDQKSYDISTAEKIVRVRRAKPSLTSRQRRIRLAVMGFLVAGLVGAIEYHFIFNKSSIVRVPVKQYEQ